jgi:hypothetical protein
MCSGKKRRNAEKNARMDNEQNTIIRKELFLMALTHVGGATENQSRLPDNA